MRQCAPHRLPILTLLTGGVWGSARLVGAGQDCGDGTSAGCVIVVAAFESPAVIAGLEVMGQPVEQRSRHLGVAEGMIELRRNGWNHCTEVES